MQRLVVGTIRKHLTQMHWHWGSSFLIWHFIWTCPLFCSTNQIDHNFNDAVFETIVNSCKDSVTKTHALYFRKDVKNCHYSGWEVCDGLQREDTSQSQQRYISDFSSVTRNSDKSAVLNAASTCTCFLISSLCQANRHWFHFCV